MSIEQISKSIGPEEKEIVFVLDMGERGISTISPGMFFNVDETKAIYFLFN